MRLKTYQRLRVIAVIFIAITVSIAVSLNNTFLALVAVFTGMIFMFFIKSRVKDVMQDERVQVVGDKAARMAYNILVLVLGLSSLFLVFFGRVSAPFLESLGYVFSYLTMFSLIVYSAAFYYFNRKYGADDEE